MATFTVTTPQNINELANKIGGDTYNINGGVLTIDSDSRYGLNTTGSTGALGTITISATLGGTLLIDGTNIKLIRFESGSGIVPAANSIISESNASGNLLGIWSGSIDRALTSPPISSSLLMPSGGFIKLRNCNNYSFNTSSALYGINASSSVTFSSANMVGWIDIVGVATQSIVANRLGSVIITGSWYELGLTTGVSNQTLQIPTSGVIKHVPGVYIEKTKNSGDFEFYPNAATLTTTGVEAKRGKVVWIDNAGLVRIGNSGAATNGYTPVADLRVVIGNIHTETCASASKGANVIPDNTTLANRYDFTTTGGGVVSASRLSSAWYLSFAQPFSVYLNEVAAVDQILLSECASPIAWHGVGVGGKPTAALATNALLMSLNFAGGSFTDCVWWTPSHAGSGRYTNSLSDVDGFTFLRNITQGGTIKGNATIGAWTLTRTKNSSFISCSNIVGKFLLTTCDNLSFYSTSYVDAISGVTLNSNGQSVWSIGTNCSNIIMDGLALPVAQNNPLTSIMQLAAAGDSNIKLRNIGTYNSPLALNTGSTVNTGLLFDIAAGAAANNIKVQRCYISNSRTGLMTADNSTTGLIMENVFGDYTDAADVAAVLNFQRKGIGGTLAVTAQTSIYGTHWFDCHTSLTGSRIGLLMNEKTSESPSVDTYTFTSNSGAGFTSAGGLYIPNVNNEIEFITPYYVLGHIAFRSSSLVMAGPTINSFSISYDIDNGTGTYSGSYRYAHLVKTGSAGVSGTPFITVSSTAGIISGTWLSGSGINSNSKVSNVLSSIYLQTDRNNIGTVSGPIIFNNLPVEQLATASVGFKTKWKIKTEVANTTAITSLYANTYSNTTSQAFQYPLDTITLTINIVDADGNTISQNCEVTVVKTADDSVLFNEENVTDGSTSYTYETSGILCYINVLNVAGYQPKTVNNYTLGASDSSLTIQLDEDRFYTT